MIDVITGLAQLMGDSILKVLPTTIGLALIFTVLNHYWACNPGPPWWQKREIATDVIYWFAIPMIARLVRIGALIVGAALIFNVQGEKELVDFFDNGHGPLAALPLWVQAILFLVLSDIPLYWLHRIFHGPSLWRYHAIHHSSEDLDWISAARFHPVNIILGAVAVDVLLLLAGISPKIMIWVGPFKIFHSAFVHANLNWTLGPLKYVIASPVFHRWHHTGLADGGNTNFATTFPIWDVLWGTFHMPTDRLPEQYGADDPALPAGFVEQTVYPFRQKEKALEPAE
jgi:sterol desaturase/sphingolipid hydroxylase (fatty acid hydroxylase superfamily)